MSAVNSTPTAPKKVENADKPDSQDTIVDSDLEIDFNLDILSRFKSKERKR